MPKKTQKCSAIKASTIRNNPIAANQISLSSAIKKNSKVQKKTKSPLRSGGDSKFNITIGKKTFDNEYRFNRELHLILGKEYRPQHRLISNFINKKKFDSWSMLQSILWENNCLTRVSRGHSMGPTSLGVRPAFSSSIITSLKVKNGEHRRHIISSSTLGKAIEDGYKGIKIATDNTQALHKLNSWLERHLIKKEITSVEALRIIWKLVHNHIGNLWVGDGNYNSAIGLIRGDLSLLLKKDNITVMDIASILPRFSSLSIEWESIKQPLISLINPNKKDGSIMQNTVNEDKELIKDWIANCDLDLPYSGSRTHFNEVSSIYLDLLNSPLKIFDENGALDRFMKLDYRESLNPSLQDPNMPK